MECPRCHYRLAVASKFCPNCGSGLSAPTQPNAAPTTFVPRKQPLWPLVLGFLLLGGGALLFAFNSGLLRSPGSPTPSKVLGAQGSVAKNDVLRSEGAEPKSDILRAEGTTPPAELLRVYGTPPESKLTTTQAEKIEMPADIRAYLQHVERIEAMRVKMAQTQLSQALMMFTELQGLGGNLGSVQELADPDAPTPNPDDAPSRKVTRSAADKRKDWGALEEEFLSVTPPAECISLRDDYGTALHETGVMISEIMDALEQAQESPEAALTALQGMQNTSGGRIDVKARSADGIVAQICSKYRTDKWFSITADVGGGSMLGTGLGFR